MKYCYACKQDKPLTDFGKNRSKKDGLQSRCRECEQDNYIRNRKKYLARGRKYQQTFGKEPHLRSCKVYRLKYPEKEKAHNVLNDAIKAGKMQRSVFCEECGLPAKTEGHHPDYSKPLKIEWLCIKCHKILHQKEIKDNEVLLKSRD